MKMTSSEAAKRLRSLEAQIAALKVAEDKSSVFNCASNEKPEDLRPAYDFAKTQAEIAALEGKVRSLKHAINLFNISCTLEGFDGLTIDQALVYIPQVRERKIRLEEMAGRLQRERVSDRFSNANYIDYQIANYDIEEAKAAYQEASDLLASLQLALDKANSTLYLEVED